VTQCVVIGTGNVGSRHLQSLAALPPETTVLGVDISPDARHLAQRRWDEARKHGGAELRLTDTLDLAAGPVDVGIVATTSDVRREVTESLLMSAPVRYLILEKVLFSRRGESEAVQELLSEHGVAAFVNYPRRMMPGPMRLRELMDGANGGSLTVSGSGWGLACNGLHFLDLASFLAGSVAMSVETVALDAGSVAAKRPGYREVTGTLAGRIGAVEWTLASDRVDDDGYELQVDLGPVVLREQHEMATITTADASRAVEHYPVRPQSELTAVVADDLLRTGTCGLTPYADAVPLHEAYLGAIAPHFGDPDTGVPVT